MDSPPKKVRRCKIFMKNWPYRTQVITISLTTENSKWQISEKKTLKLPKFQKLISQEPFRVRWKNFAHFCFLLVGTLSKIWSKSERMGDKIEKFIHLWHRIVLKSPYLTLPKQSNVIYLWVEVQKQKNSRKSYENYLKKKI